MTDFTPGVVAVAEEAFFRQAMSDALAAVGIACATAGTGEQALREAENPAVGVVVLDLQLPGGSGLDLLERLRALRHEIRVIVLSTATDQDLALQALRTHACDYLAKPLHEEELVLTVGRALRGPDQAWVRIRKSAKLDDVRIHDLRHSFASVAVGLGEGLPIVGKLLGHSVPQTTARYGHVARDPAKFAADRVGAAIEGMMRGTSGEVVKLPR